MAASIAARKAVNLREATLADFDGIHALENRYQLGHRNRQDWEHLWVANSAWNSDWPIGWVLEDGTGEIVGSIGNIPMSYEFRARRVIVAASHSWVADQRYRAYGLALLNRYIAQRGVDVYLCTSANASAEWAVATECERVPVGNWSRAAFWITNYRAFARSALIAKKVDRSAILQYPAALGMKVRDMARRHLGTGAPLAVTSCTAFDDRFDEFWNRLRTANRDRLLAVRSRESLEWHFTPALRRNALWIYTVATAGRLRAYGIFYVKDVPAIGLRRVRLMDYQCLEQDFRTLTAMLSTAISRCREEGVAVLESIGWQLEPGDMLDALAPHFRSLPSWQYYYHAGTAELAGALKSRGAWNPTQFDTVASL